MDFSSLKLRTLFDPIALKKQFSQQQQPMGQGQIDTQFDPISQMNSIYQPQNQASQAYTNSINNMPVQSQPGMLQKIASIIASMGSSRPSGIVGGSPIGFEYNPAIGHAASEEALHPGFSDDMKDWTARTEMLGKAAGQEQQYNTNQRILANDTLSREQGARNERNVSRRLDITENKNQIDAELANKRIDIANKRADAYALKNERPNLKYFTDKDGMVKAFNPDDNSVSNLGIDTKDLNDTDKLRMQLHNSLEEIKAKGEQTRLTKETIPAKNPNVSQPKQPTAANTNRDLLNRAQKLWNERPDLQQYLETSNGKPTGNIKPAGGGLFGMGAGDKSKESEARALLYPASNTAINQALPPIEKRVVGQTYTMPDGNKAKWNGKGFDGVQ